ncbi:Oidioi.mRNA.OKI2018_I69.PAR.g10487.t1.cds [Oikopleura dioica]|uniref:Oidioi.mRNA.OKI2018_I69.PAR.g10487.t1.cds n=1 Tax=Oikopleura dioica TaxID=34765 RepID=A0ABN7RV30_OIKDI|nr:Oidioi.mRNA.OKI2018_I69.PAR.g10487.t1.cds [Oikopleura dioica]
MTINVIYSPGNAYHMSRKEIIDWVNDTLHTNIVKIGELGEGSHYCQLLDMIFPDLVQMRKVKWNCKHEIDKINNFKVLQEAFKLAEIDKKIPINDLTKKRF